MSLTFTTAVKRQDPIEFDLDGDHYIFTPPKRAGIILDVLTVDDEQKGVAFASGMVKWTLDGLGPEGASRIRKRLKDPRDDFDIADLTDIGNRLVSEVSGRPLDSASRSPISSEASGSSSTIEEPSKDSTPSTSPSTGS